MPPFPPPHPVRTLARALLAACLRRDSAQATLEFVLVMPVVLIFVMAMFNFAGLSIAHQLAQYTAFTAARIAIVNPEDKDKWAFMVMTPISPSDTSILPFPIPVPEPINKLLEEICGINNAGKRAAYAALSTFFRTTFYDANDKPVNAGGLTRKQLIEKSAYVKTEASYFYFTPFPFLNELTQYLAQRNETYVIGGYPIHLHDPVKGMKSWIFFGDKILTGPAVYKEAYALDMLHKGTVVIPVYQTTMMGIN